MTLLTHDMEHPVTINIDSVILEGNLYVPQQAKGIVLFAHGSGSSRFSVRNQFVARVLQEAKLATLLFDLLTPEEEKVDEQTRELRFNIDFLASRLVAVTEWTAKQLISHKLSIGYFGASTGAGAAIVSAVHHPELVKAVVSRGGRPDMAGEALMQLHAPTLLIVGGADDIVIELNKSAMEKMSCEKELIIVPGATHLFEEPGALNQVAQLATAWFKKYLF